MVDWLEDVKQWIVEEAVWYCGSFVLHLLLLCVLCLMGSQIVPATEKNEALTLEPARTEAPEPTPEPWSRDHEGPPPDMTPIEMPSVEPPVDTKPMDPHNPILPRRRRVAVAERRAGRHPPSRSSLVVRRVMNRTGTQVWAHAWRWAMGRHWPTCRLGRR